MFDVDDLNIVPNANREGYLSLMARESWNEKREARRCFFTVNNDRVDLGDSTRRRNHWESSWSDTKTKYMILPSGYNSMYAPTIAVIMQQLFELDTARCDVHSSLLIFITLSKL